MRDLPSKIFARVIGFRNRLYDRGFKETHRLGGRTISIGNITVGGTGKTPIVELVSRMLAENCERVCILTRGYGRRDENKNIAVSNGVQVLANADEAGDEPFELAENLLGKASVVANADRVAAAASMMEFMPPSVFVLDDAFQHRRVFRDLDIVCIDATDPFGGGKLLPNGRLREPLSSLKRADAFIITRTDLVDSVKKTEETIRKHNPSASIFHAATRIFGTSRVGKHRYDPQLRQSDRSTPVFAACAIGNPDAFFETLRKDGRNVVGIRAFRDHHRFTADDARSIESEAVRSGAEAILITRKDAVKIREYEFEMPVYAVLTKTLVKPEEEFRRMVLGV